MSALPSGWVTAQLSDLLYRIEGGLNVKCEERPPEPCERGLVKISSVTWGRFDAEQSKTLPSDFVPAENARICTGDLLISRANTVELVGASVIVERIERRLYLSDKVLRLVVHEPAKRWINYALKTPTVRKEIENASSGNQLSMRNISQDKLRSLRLPLAPEAEQRRIADKLDTVLARVDAVNDRLARVAPLLKRFRQSVLAAATSGKLTEEWRQSRGVPLGREVRWKSAALGSIAKFVDYRGKTPTKTSSGVPLITAKNVRSGFVSVEPREFIAESDYGEWMTRGFPRVGDVLITTEAPLGNVALIDWTYKFALAQRLICMQFDPEVLGAFAAIALQSPSFQKSLLEQATGTTVAGIKASRLKDLAIPVPSRAEQTEIVRCVELLFGYADRLEARLKAAQTATERLTPALLAKAFRGELVPQDPNDEPASELLRRLAESRAAAPAPRKRGRPSRADA